MPSKHAWCVLFAHQNCVCIHDGGEAVGHDDGGDVRAYSTQGGLDLLLRQGVERAGGLQPMDMQDARLNVMQRQRQTKGGL